MKIILATLAFAAMVGCANRQMGDAGADPQLVQEIAQIKAIDNHAHPVRPTAQGEKPDDEYDALPVDNLEPQSDPFLQRPHSPEVDQARRQLFGNDKAATVRAHASDYATWVLDQAGIDIMLANRVAMGPGLPPARFRWVPFADALMYPLNNDALIHNPDQKAFFPLEEKLLKRYYTECGVTEKPAKLGDYLDKVVRPTLERHKAGGALAEKFEMAYLRPLDVGNPTREQAERAYNGSGDYKALQDY